MVLGDQGPDCGDIAVALVQMVGSDPALREVGRKGSPPRSREPACTHLRWSDAHAPSRPCSCKVGGFSCHPYTDRRRVGGVHVPPQVITLVQASK